MTAPDSEATVWSPDELLVPALLAGSPTTMADLDPYDRAWVIASLKLEGLTADQMKDRLDCSLRQVRAIAAEPGAVMARLYLIEREAFADTLRMAQSEVRRLDQARAAAESAAARYKAQLDRLLDRMLVGDGGPTFRCGHAKTRYNTYVAPKTGKENCRQCHADAQADYRARKAGRGGVTTGVHNGPQGGHHGTQVSASRPGQRASRRSSLDGAVSA